MGQLTESEVSPISKLKYSSPLANFAVSSLELQKDLPVFDQTNPERNSLSERMKSRGDAFFRNVISSVPPEHRETVRKEIISLRTDIHALGLSVEDQIALKAFANSISSSFGLKKEPIWQRIKRNVFIRISEEVKTSEIITTEKPTIIPIYLEHSAVSQAEQLLTEIQMKQKQIAGLRQ